MGDLANLFGGGQFSSTKLQDPFGNVPYGMAGQLRNFISPLLGQLGFGGGNPRMQERRADQLASATGPLAGYIRDVQGLSGQVGPEAQQVGQQVAALGSQDFQTLTNQVMQGIQANQGALQGAQQYQREAFDPTSMDPFFTAATTRAVQPLRSEFASRGLGGTGAELAAEEQARTGLTQNFAQEQLGMQAQAPQLVSQLASQGAGLAGNLFSAIPQFGQTQLAPTQIPMQQLSSLFQMLTGGLQPGQQLLAGTAPQFTPFGGPVAPFGIRK